MFPFPETNFTAEAVGQMLEQEDGSRTAQLIAAMIGLSESSKGGGGASDPRVALVEHYCACLGAGRTILNTDHSKIAALLNVCQGTLASCASLRWPPPAAGEAERAWAQLLAASSATTSADRAAAAHAAYKRGATYGSRAALSLAMGQSSAAFGNSTGVRMRASGTHGEDGTASNLLFSAAEAQVLDEWTPRFGTLYAYPLLRLAFLGDSAHTKVEIAEAQCELTIETPHAPPLLIVALV